MNLFGLMRRSVICLLIPIYSFSQNINRGPRATALGRSGVALTDIWCLQSNPSGAAWIDKVEVGVASQNLYWGSDIRTNSIVAILPVKSTVLGLIAQSYGIPEYGDLLLGTSFARRFGDVFSASLSINMHHLQIQEIGSSRTFSIDAGFFYKISDYSSLGLHVANPFISKYKTETTYKVPSVFQLGGAFLVSSNVLLVCQLETIDNFSSFTAGSGMEVDIHKEFKLRGGLSLFPFCHYAGLGYQQANLIFQIAVSSHPILGYSPQASLSYGF